MHRQERDVFVRGWQWRGTPWREMKRARRRGIPGERLALEGGDAFLVVALFEQCTGAAGIRLKAPRQALHVVERHGCHGGLCARLSAATGGRTVSTDTTLRQCARAEAESSRGGGGE